MRPKARAARDFDPLSPMIRCLLWLLGLSNHSRGDARLSEPPLNPRLSRGEPGCKTLHLIALAAAVAITASSGKAEDTLPTEFLTGQQLYNMCTDGNGVNYCGWYIDGAVDQLVMYSYTMKTNFICLPANIQTQQIEKLVVDELSGLGPGKIQ